MPEVLNDFNCLQRPSYEDFDDELIEHYKDMYDCFFEDRHLIPDGHFYETSYEQLVQHPMQEMRAIYESLHLPDFKCVESRLLAYLDKIAEYRTNRYVDIPPAVQGKILHHWERFFDAWGYAKQPNQFTS